MTHSLTPYWILAMILSIGITSATHQAVDGQPSQPSTAAVDRIMNSLEYLICFEIFQKQPVQTLTRRHEELKDFLPDNADPEEMRQKYFAGALQSCVEKALRMDNNAQQDIVLKLRDKSVPVDYWKSYYVLDDSVYQKGKVELTPKEKDTIELYANALKELREAQKHKRQSDPTLKELDQAEDENRKVKEVYSQIQHKFYFDTFVTFSLGAFVGMLFGSIYACYRFGSRRTRTPRQAHEDMKKSREEEVDKKWADLKSLRQEVQRLEKSFSK